MSTSNFSLITPEIIAQALVGYVQVAISNIAAAARRLAPTKRLQGAIEELPVAQLGGTIESGVTVSTILAPEACAYEFGSGIHDTKGNQGKYRIAARNAGGNLVFQWDNEPSAVKIGAAHTKDGKVILPFVNHPGVVARPYLGPAFDEILNDNWEDGLTTTLMSMLDTSEVTITLETLYL
jgi:hypothetical protein